MSKFICATCGKEQDTYPRSVGYDGKTTCWRCSNLQLYNKYEGRFEKLKNDVKEYMLESYDNLESIFMIDDLVEFFENKEDIYDFDIKLNHLREEIRILKEIY